MPVRIQTPKTTFTVDYPQAVEFMDKQASVFWPHFEIKVHKDKHDILVNMTEAERHGTVETLRLFTKYEEIIGNEFWLNFVMQKFPRPADIQPMAALFGAMELAVHEQFYKTLNDVLGLSSDEFYDGYKEDPELAQRIAYLQDVLKEDDDLRALGAFTFGEGAILYSSFAFLKHFQSSGKNKLLNVVSGINFSARDEALHAEAAAWLFRTLRDEKFAAGEIDQEYLDKLEQDMYKAADIVLEHERLINKKIFAKGPIDNITETQLDHFSQSRLNLCLRECGYKNRYEVKYNPIAEWFYKGINGYSSTDFFNSTGNQYQRDWNELGFTWKDKGVN